jgi:predicted phage terminase large subunit-like protein
MTPKGANFKEVLKEYNARKERLQSGSTIDRAEPLKERLSRVARARKDYAFFVSYYFNHYCTDAQTGKAIPAAAFHVKAANMLKNNRNIQAVFQWARGHAKSTNMDIFMPLWLMCQEKPEINVVALVGKSWENAVKLISDIQVELEYNDRYINDFGIHKGSGTWADGKFITNTDIAFYALGRGQSPRGLRYKSKRPDYIIIDDLDDDELCRNKARVTALTEWVRTALFGCFGAEGGRFVMVGNLISNNSVLKNISDIGASKVSKVNIIDKKGNPSWADFWTLDRIERQRQAMGFRAFEREYMNNPVTEGAVFKNEWIQWVKPLPLHKYEQIVAYCDPSFKNSATSDYKAIKMWGRYGSSLHLLSAFVRRCSIAEMVRRFYDLHESLPDNVVCEYYIEANFLQDLLLDEFATEGDLRGYQLPIRADRRSKPDKFQRVEATSPLYERGVIAYNENLKTDPDMQTALDQLLGFEKGARVNDDSPDADEGAIFILQQGGRNDRVNPEFISRADILKQSKHRF